MKNVFFGIDKIIISFCRLDKVLITVGLRDDNLHAEEGHGLFSNTFFKL